MRTVSLKPCIALLALMMAAEGAMAHDLEIDGLYYNLVSMGSYTIAEVTYDGSDILVMSDGITVPLHGCYSGSVTIPPTIMVDGVTYNVRHIGERAFQGCDSLTSVTIPEGVEMIRDDAFCNCSSLKSIDLPESVWSIGSEAFLGCTSLTSFVIPPKETIIRDRTFWECRSLASVTIHPNVTEIRTHAFFGCWSLTSVDIPSGMTRIGIDAFGGCVRLSSITLPPGLTCIEASAFHGCSSLKAINIPSKVTSIESGAFAGCQSLKTIDVPWGVTSIGSSAFSGCTGLISTTIPSSVTHIGGWAFRQCTGELILYCDIESRYSYDTPLLDAEFTSIKMYGKKAGSNAFANMPTLTSVEFGNNVSSIGQDAFFKCTGIKAIYAMSTTPPWGTYSGVQYFCRNAILYVPIGCKEAYENAEGWKEFADIREMDFGTSVKAITDNSPIHISAAGNVLTIRNNGIAMPVTVYTTDGKQVTSTVAERGSTRTTLRKGTTYLVKMGRKTYKIAM